MMTYITPHSAVCTTNLKNSSHVVRINIKSVRSLTVSTKQRKRSQSVIFAIIAPWYRRRSRSNSSFLRIRNHLTAVGKDTGPKACDRTMCTKLEPMAWLSEIDGKDEYTCCIFKTLRSEGMLLLCYSVVEMIEAAEEPALNAYLRAVLVLSCHESYKQALTK